VESGGVSSDRDFPSITEIGECSKRGKSSGELNALGKGMDGSSLVKYPAVQQPIREEDCISPGMFRLAMSEDREWRRRQAAEVGEMLFRTPQPCQMRGD
jgi:hypothetical protein